LVLYNTALADEHRIGLETKQRAVVFNNNIFINYNIIKLAVGPDGTVLHHNAVLNFRILSHTITQRGKTPEELQADLLAGEPDDLSVDFTNVINYYGDGSK